MPFGSYQLSLQANVASSHYTLFRQMVSQTGLRGWRLLHTMPPPTSVSDLGTQAIRLGASCSSQGLWVLVTLLVPTHTQELLQPQGWCHCFFHCCFSIHSTPLQSHGHAFLPSVSPHPSLLLQCPTHPIPAWCGVPGSEKTPSPAMSTPPRWGWLKWGQDLKRLIPSVLGQVCTDVHQVPSPRVKFRKKNLFQTSFPMGSFLQLMFLHALSVMPLLKHSLPTTGEEIRSPHCDTSSTRLGSRNQAAGAEAGCLSPAFLQINFPCRMKNHHLCFSRP